MNKEGEPLVPTWRNLELRPSCYEGSYDKLPLSQAVYRAYHPDFRMRLPSTYPKWSCSFLQFAHQIEGGRKWFWFVEYPPISLIY